MGGGITRIGNWLLGGVNSGAAKTKITLPDSLREIGKLAFYGTEMEGVLRIPDNVVRIEAGGLKNVNTRAISIGRRAELSEDTVTGFRAAEVGGKDTAKIVVHEKNQFLRSVNGVLYSKGAARLWAYPAAATRKTYKVRKETRTIGTYAFYDCTLDRLVLPDKLEVLEENAFVGCNVEELRVKSKLEKAEKAFVGEEGTICKYKGMYFYKDAPAEVPFGEGVRAAVYYPSGNATWRKELRDAWKEVVGERQLVFRRWKPGQKMKNEIRIDNIVVNAQEKDYYYTPIGAKATGGTITYSCDDPVLKVSNSGGGSVFVPAYYIGQTTITVSTKGNLAYAPASKTISFVIIAADNAIWASDIELPYSATEDQRVQVPAMWLGHAKATYLCSDPAIRISADGIVTVEKGYEGEAEIMITVPPEGAYAGTERIIKITVSRDITEPSP